MKTSKRKIQLYEKVNALADKVFERSELTLPIPYYPYGCHTAQGFEYILNRLVEAEKLYNAGHKKAAQLVANGWPVADALK